MARPSTVDRSDGATARRALVRLLLQHQFEADQYRIAPPRQNAIADLAARINENDVQTATQFIRSIADHSYLSSAHQNLGRQIFHDTTIFELGADDAADAATHDGVADAMHAADIFYGHR